MEKTRTDLTTYNEDALRYFVTNNNKFKRIFIESKDFDSVVLPMINNSFVYTQRQLEVLKKKWERG
jgi:hypothetical protein